MGNTFEARASFDFEGVNAEKFINQCIEYYKFIYENTEYYYEHTDAAFSFVNNNQDMILCQGIKAWNTKREGHYRDFDPTIKAHIDIKDEYGEIHECIGLNIGIDLTFGVYKDECENEVEGIIPDYSKFVTAEDIINMYFNGTNILVFNIHKVDLNIKFYSCEKYNSDEGLFKLVELWSPYTTSEYIGKMYDEDSTFYKEYYRYNKDIVKHFDFCGEWCSKYEKEVSCNDLNCINLYNLAFKAGYKKLAEEYAEKFGLSKEKEKD